MKIAEIRRIIDSARWLRNDLTGGTATEFARMNVGPQLEEKRSLLATLEIPTRFADDIKRRDEEMQRLVATIEKWTARRKAHLDELTSRITAFKSFDQLINAPGGYFPSLRRSFADQEWLGKRYDEAQEARGDNRRVFWDAFAKQPEPAAEPVRNVIQMPEIRPSMDDFKPGTVLRHVLGIEGYVVTSFHASTNTATAVLTIQISEANRKEWELVR
jgi:hypothetical protein